MVHYAWLVSACVESMGYYHRSQFLQHAQGNLGKVFGLVYPIGMCFQLLMSRKWSALRRKRQIAVVADGATFIARGL